MCKFITHQYVCTSQCTNVVTSNVVLPTGVGVIGRHRPTCLHVIMFASTTCCLGCDYSQAAAQRDLRGEK